MQTFLFYQSAHPTAEWIRLGNWQDATRTKRNQKVWRQLQILLNLWAWMGRMRQTPKERSNRPQQHTNENCLRFSKPTATGVAPKVERQSSLPDMRICRLFAKDCWYRVTSTSTFGSGLYNKQTTTVNQEIRRLSRSPQRLPTCKWKYANISRRERCGNQQLLPGGPQ